MPNALSCEHDFVNPQGWASRCLAPAGRRPVGTAGLACSAARACFAIFTAAAYRRLLSASVFQRPAASAAWAASSSPEARWPRRSFFEVLTASSDDFFASAWGNFCALSRPAPPLVPVAFRRPKAALALAASPRLTTPAAASLCLLEREILGCFGAWRRHGGGHCPQAPDRGGLFGPRLPPASAARGDPAPVACAFRAPWPRNDRCVWRRHRGGLFLLGTGLAASAETCGLGCRRGRFLGGCRRRGCGRLFLSCSQAASFGSSAATRRPPLSRGIDRELSLFLVLSRLFHDAFMAILALDTPARPAPSSSATLADAGTAFSPAATAAPEIHLDGRQERRRRFPRLPSPASALRR